MNKAIDHVLGNARLLGAIIVGTVFGAAATVVAVLMMLDDAPEPRGFKLFFVGVVTLIGACAGVKLGSD